MPGLLKTSNTPAGLGIWADGPVALVETPKYQTRANDQFTEMSSVMAVVHNSIIRGYNSIYRQAPNVTPAEYKDFVGYAMAWYELLDAHHRGEEEFGFPAIEAAVGIEGLMQPNIEQHEAFHDGLEAYAAYLKPLLTDASAFSAQKLVEIMDSFSTELFTHLNDEIPTILALEKYADKLDLMKMFDEEGDKTMGALSKTGALPFFFLNNDVTFEDGMWAEFPPAPKPLKWAVCHVFTIYNQRWWKFASCDTYGHPKPLHCPTKRV